MSNKLIWGSDLYKGFKLDKNTLLGGAIDDILPFQMLTLEQKNADWVKAVADYYEVAGWNNVGRKALRIQNNYWMRYGKLNPSDYIINPTQNDYYQAVNLVLPDNNNPLQQFYPLAPNFVEVLRGEYIKRDNTWTVEAIDDMSKAEVLKFKQSQFEQILMQQAALEKQKAMYEMGITEESDPDQYMQEMQNLQNQMTNVEMESRNFRTTGVKWAEKVLKIQEKRYNLHEIGPDGFESGLITDSEYYHLDLLDDDFKLELINPKWADKHKGPGTKYVSDGDYFLWFDWGSAGDIVNKFGRRMKEEDILKLKDIYVKTSNIIVPDYLKSHQGSYYDLSKGWMDATDLDPKMNDALLGKELAYSFMRSPNFEHNQEVDILNPIWGRKVTGHPQMFRIMRLYWRSLKRIGWLTKIDRDGTRTQPDWVDENYKVTVEPQHDTSVVKTKSKDNLLYGEHIDWTWVPEWRHVIKISPNQKHTFWLNSRNTLESIYIDGDPVKFQFKGINNPFDSLPPVEGCEYSYLNTTPHSFIDRIKPMQIIYNICMNRVPKKILDDKGIKLAVHRSMLNKPNLSSSSASVDPHEALEEKLSQGSVFDYSYNPEDIRGMGQPPLPTVLNMSTAEEARFYFDLAREIKWEAGELIGITRQRQGGQKASETAYSVQQGIQYSETQTEKLFEQHSNLMQRVRQRMLDAAQYYTTFNESSRDVYLNEAEETMMLQIEGMENLLPHYSINLQSRANTRAALQRIASYLENNNTLNIPGSVHLQGIVEQSVPKLMEAIRKGEAEMKQREDIERNHEMQMEEARRQTILSQMQLQQDFEASQNELDRQKDIDVATIRALGGIQTDVDANSQIDASQNLDMFFKQQEILNKYQAQKDALNAKRQSDMDKLLVEREKAMKDIEKAKIQGQYALKVAEENRTAAEIKARSNKKKSSKK